jgi:hypothetical protein
MDPATAPGPKETTADRLYAFLVEEEDARVCKDIPAEACKVVPGNFFRLGASQVLTKLADELSSAKTILPWVLSSVAAPGFLIGVLVPIRESGSLLPQLAIAAAVRRQTRRKYLWVLGGILQAVALTAMAASALLLRDAEAGVAIVGLLVLFSLARGLVSVASKDVTGKTIPKTRRGRLTGFTTALAGALALALGGILAAVVKGDPTRWTVASLLAGAALLWILSATIVWTVKEEPGATSGGRDAIREALQKLTLLKTDVTFRRFVWVRALLISTGLAAPFYVALARETSSGGNLLALFVLASGLASAVSSGFWGRYSDRSSKSVMVAAATIASSLGTFVFLLDTAGLLARFTWIAPLAFFFLAIAHAGIRVGRKTYLLDIAGGERRTDYVAVSNTVIGLVLLLAGGVGFLAPLVGSGGVLLVLSGMGFAGVWWGRRLPEAQ